jgi:hypothetical protein
MISPMISTSLIEKRRSLTPRSSRVTRSQGSRTVPGARARGLLMSRPPSHASASLGEVLKEPCGTVHSLWVKA